MEGLNLNTKLIIMRKKVLLFLVITLLIPLLSLANGGDQRVVENKYFVNLSRAPFTPRVGVKTSFLPSFVDIQKDKLIAEDLIVRVRIAKLGGVGANKREFIFEKDNIPVRGGVLDGLSYTFNEPGLHEIFFDFTFISDPQKIYEVPDFLIDVQKQPDGYNINQLLITGFATFVTGVIIGWFIKRIMNRKVG